MSSVSAEWSDDCQAEWGDQGEWEGEASCSALRSEVHGCSALLQLLEAAAGCSALPMLLEAADDKLLVF